jgi:hypothetical protein
MMVVNSPQLKTLMKANKTFKMNFEKLIEAFQNRIPTKDVGYLFKVLCEDLFRSYNIPVEVHVHPSFNGDILGNGKLVIEFLNEDVLSPLDHDEPKSLKDGKDS